MRYLIGAALALAGALSLASGAHAQAPTRKVYADTSLTACPAGESLEYFYNHWSGLADFPAVRGPSWCGAAQAGVDYANVIDTVKSRLPYLLEQCVPGQFWVYSHRQGSGKYISPPVRGINMVCNTQATPAPVPLGCLNGAGQFSACPRTPLRPVVVRLPGVGTPRGGGLGVNGGRPGTTRSNDPVPIRTTGSPPTNNFPNWTGCRNAQGLPAVCAVDPPPPILIMDTGSPWEGGVNPGAGWNFDSSNDSYEPSPGGTFGDDSSTDGYYGAVATDGSTCTASSAGNPIFVGTGNKHQSEVDYTSPLGLQLIRNYNSSTPGWVHNFGVRIYADATTAIVIRPDGRAHTYTGSSLGVWAGDATASEQLIRLDPASNAGAAWKYVTGTNAAEWYDANGAILRIVAADGRAFLAQQSNGLLASISDASGRKLQFAYDAQDRLVGITTPEGTTISYGYNAAGHLAQVTYPDGTQRKYLYENAAYPLALTGIINERGVRYVTWTYDADGRAVSSERAGGVQRHQLAFDADGTVRITDPLGTVRTQRYATAGDRKVYAGQSQPCTNCVDDAASKTVDPATGLVLAETDYLGVNTLFTYDTQRKLPQTVTHAVGRPEQRRVEYEWHPTLSRPTTIREAGRATSFTYDAQGRTLSMTRTDLVSGASRHWAWTYNSQGLRDSATDPSGGVWRFAYDAAGNRTSTTDPAGHVTSFTHDVSGRVVTMTDAAGLTVRYGYDARGRLVSEDRGGEVSTYTYTPTGHLQQASLANGFQVTYSYDDANRLIGTADNLGNAVRWGLDAAGNRIRTEMNDSSGQLGVVAAQVIDTLNRVSQIQGASGQSTRIGYDANGTPISLTDPLNNTTVGTLDGLGRTIATTLPDGLRTQQAWNGQDQLAQFTDAGNVATRFEYNAFGEVLSESSPDIGTIRYGRDQAGAIISVEDARGRITRIERDVLGRPTRISYAGGASASFHYDVAGRLRSAEDPSGSTSFERDAQGRVLQKTQSINDNPANPTRLTATYAYQNGELTGVGYPSGLQVTYRRQAGRITGIDLSLPSSTRAPFVSGLTYNALGRARSWQWSNGDAALRVFDLDGRMTSNEFANYGYDAAGRMTGITQMLWASKNGQSGALQQVPFSWSVTYDNRGRLTGFKREGAETSYTYDGNSNRLTSMEVVSSDSDLDGALSGDNRTVATQQALTFDGTSNRLMGFDQTVVLTINGKKHSETALRIPYRLDANGALTSDGLREFQYDDAGRLSRVTLSKNGEAAHVSYLHNGWGQRAFKSEVRKEQGESQSDEVGASFVNWLKANFGWLYGATRAQSSLGTAFIYGDEALPAWALLGEYDNGTAASRGRSEYIWLPTMSGAELVGVVKNGRVYAIHTDHLGTPRLVTDDQLKPVWQWPYSAFGSNMPSAALKATASGSHQNLKGTQPVVELNLRFPGQYFDEESALSYNYRRSYLAQQGRYTQADPVGLSAGPNRFAYVDGRPLSKTDPEGLTAVSSPANMSVPAPDSNGADQCVADWRFERKACYQMCQAIGRAMGGASGQAYIETCVLRCNLNHSRPGG